MTSQVLVKLISTQAGCKDRFTYSFGPVNRDVRAVDVGRRPILQVFETRVARLLGKASLVAKIEETANAVLAGLETVVLNEPESR
jgi:hypothetical protein